MVRPRIHPSNKPFSLVRISAGACQLLFGPASTSSSEQIKVHSTIISRFETVDENGNTISEKNEEIVECDDGVKDFLQDAGIADDCKYYTWTGMEGYTPVEYRTLACHKLDGGYEIIPNYSGIE